MIETSGHGALKENHFLDDGAYLAVKLLIEVFTYFLPYSGASGI